MTARDVAIADLETLKFYEHGYTGSTPCYANVARYIAQQSTMLDAYRGIVAKLEAELTALRADHALALEHMER